MKDLAKECLRLSYENRLLKNKIKRQEREYLELARRARNYVEPPKPWPREEEAKCQK